MRPPKENETDLLVKMAEQTGIFKSDEAEQLLGSTLKRYHQATLGEHHYVEVMDDSVTKLPVGWVYYSPSLTSDGVWDLWWIGVSVHFQRSGFGTSLLNHVETKVRHLGGRILIIETSSSEKLNSARQCYLKMGYAKCGQIPHFYGQSEDKIIFAKNL